MMQIVSLLLACALFGFAIGWETGRRQGRKDCADDVECAKVIADIVRKRRDGLKFIGCKCIHRFDVAFTLDGKHEPARIVFGEDV